jgi:uncharacterized cupredoxin-like copper-binding protein
MSINIFRCTVGAALFAIAQATTAGPGHSGNTGIGEPGSSAPSRTIEVVMYDNYYNFDSLDIKEGETVRFIVKNEGMLVHEFNLGTEAMHIAHEPEMLMMVQHGVLKPTSIDHKAAKAMQDQMGHGEHNDPNSVLLEPGQSGEIVWTFPKHSKEQIQFACNVPGHYAAGMVGTVALVH